MKVFGVVCHIVCQEPFGMVWGLSFGELGVLAFKEVLFDLALDGLPILTSGQNVPPKGGSWNGFSWGGFSLVGYCDCLSVW